ncbi:site-specific integrase [Rhodanobacter sp. B04]|jgi:integrase|uniref:tyrosine-type recombinase/integrase n=1 Tax=Rhodanobacter sp. B04 TaxID=1945860 RepID=UPI00111578DD|nr:site-specific integrase [Rhodanobacter sp. B04]
MAKIKFTEPFIKTLPLPTAHHVLYHDEVARGLAVRITRTGSRSFLFCYSHDGRERRLSMGPWSPPASNRLGTLATRKAGGTLDWARQEAARLRLLVQSGADPMQQKQDARAEREAARQQAAREITIETLASRYIAEWAKPRKRTWPEDERRLDAIVVPAWGKRKVKSITRADVSALLAPVATGAGMRPAEAGARLALVRKLFSFAMDQGIIDMHPCLRMQLPCGKPAPRTRALTTAHDLRVLWRVTEPGSLWAREPANSALRERRFIEAEADALRLLLLTAARASEVTDMPWSELDLDAAIWVLPAARSKNKRTHLVPLVPAAVELLRRRRETSDSEYVFPATRRDHITDRNLSRPLKEVCQRLIAYGVDIAPFTPHDLRRTVETGMAASRVPKEYRDRVLNHVDSSVGGMHYNMYDYMDEKREALEKWARRLEGLLADTVATVVPMRRRIA